MSIITQSVLLWNTLQHVLLLHQKKRPIINTTKFFGPPVKPGIHMCKESMLNTQSSFILLC